MPADAASKLERLLTALCTCSLESLREPARSAAATLCKKLEDQLELPPVPNSSLSIATELKGNLLTRPVANNLDGVATAILAETAGVEPANETGAGMSAGLPMNHLQGGHGTEFHDERATPLAHAQCFWMGVLLPDSRRLVDVTAIPGSLHSCCADQRPGANLASRALWQWSACQEHSLTAQLEMGVRVLDLALCYELDAEQQHLERSPPRATYNFRHLSDRKLAAAKAAAPESLRPSLESAPPRGELWVSNSLASSYTLHAALAEVVTFLHAHPTEFVILSFGRDPELDRSWCAPPCQRCALRSPFPTSIRGSPARRLPAP